MNKILVLTVLLLSCTCIGCSRMTGQEETGDNEAISDSTDTEEKVPPTVEETEKEALTLEKIKQLSSLGWELGLQDLLVWEDLQESALSEGASARSYYYTIPEGEKEYRLDFLVRQDDSLGYVRLVDMDSMLSTDLRAGNVEHLLCNSISMEDYLTFQLPEDVTAGAYDPYAGYHFGGCELSIATKGEIATEGGTADCGGIYILDGDRVEPRVVSGKMLAVSEYENNIYHEEEESLSLEQCPALLTLMSVEEDGGDCTQYYSVYFKQDTCFYCYNLRLRADLFTREEAVEIAKTVQFAY